MAALAGSAAAALVVTSAKVTLRTKNETYADLRSQSTSFQSEAEALQRDLAQLIQEDAELFAVYVAIRQRRDKATGAERTSLAHEAREALKPPARKLMAISEKCLLVASFALRFANQGPWWASGDAHTAFFLAIAAVESGIAIIATNIDTESRYSDADNSHCTTLVQNAEALGRQVDELRSNLKRFQDQPHVVRFLNKTH